MKQKLIFLFVTGIVSSALSRMNIVEGANFVEWMIYFLLISMFMNNNPFDK